MERNGVYGERRSNTKSNWRERADKQLQITTDWKRAQCHRQLLNSYGHGTKMGGDHWQSWCYSLLWPNLIRLVSFNIFVVVLDDSTSIVTHDMLKRSCFHVCFINDTWLKRSALLHYIATFNSYQYHYISPLPILRWAIKYVSLSPLPPHLSLTCFS